MSLRTTFFLAHAAADHEFALELAQFLEAGCDVICYADEGMLPQGGDLLSKAEEGLAADVLMLLLSEDAWPARRPRQEWEPILADQAREADAEVAAFLLSECPFPEVWRRRNFFDGSRERLKAMRLVKRWFWQRRRASGAAPNTVFSRDLEAIYRDIADRAGMLRAGGEMADRFAREAVEEFEAVVWVSAYERSLAQISGELGAQLGVTLEGTVEDNCERIRDLLGARRCLLVLDAPSGGHEDWLVPRGRTSTLITEDAVRVAATPETFEYARKLILARRNAEAYELLHRLLEGEIASEACARELTWICQEWGRVEEANALRFYYGPEPAAQLTLF
jgi:TIR domain